MWWRNLYYPGPIKDWNQKELNTKLGSLLNELSDQAGTQQLFKDTAFERRTTFLGALYKELHNKAENLKVHFLLSKYFFTILRNVL